MDITRDTLEDFFQGLKLQFKAGQSFADIHYPKFSTEVRSSSAQELYRWMDQLPQLRKWVGERVIKNISTSGFTVVNEKYESTIEVFRDDLEDDNLGIYGPLAQGLGMEASKHPDLLASAILNDNTALGYDGVALLSASHQVTESGGGSAQSNYDSGGAGPRWYLIDSRVPLKPVIFQKRTDVDLVALTDPSDPEVFKRDAFQFGTRVRYAMAPGFWQSIYASNQALDATNFQSAFEAMTALTDKNGQPMGLRPDMLMVPTNRHFDALELLRAERDASGATNINRNMVDTLIVNPYLATS